MATRAESVMDVNGKRVLVVGLGKSGVASALFLEKRGARVTVSDAKSPDQLRHEIPLLLDHGVTVETGQHGERTFRDQDLIVISPGVPFDVPQLVQARPQRRPIGRDVHLVRLKGAHLKVRPLPIFCHPEPTSVGEGTTFSRFRQTISPLLLCASKARRRFTPGVPLPSLLPWPPREWKHVRGAPATIPSERPT